MDRLTSALHDALSDEGDAGDVEALMKAALTLAAKRGRVLTYTITWDAAIRQFLVGDLDPNCAKKTRMFYESRLNSLWHWVEEQKITLPTFNTADFKRYCIEREEMGISLTTRIHDTVVARRFFQYCRTEGLIPDNPLYRYKAGRFPRGNVYTPSEDELRRLLDAIHDRWNPAKNRNAHACTSAQRAFLKHRDYAIIACQIEVGARSGEILNLRCSDYCKERKMLTLTKTKNRHTRNVPLSDTSIAVIDTWLAVRDRCRIESDLLFLSIQGTPLNSGYWSKHFSTYRKFAKLDRFTPHSLRHYTLHELAARDLHVASLLAGHEDIRTTSYWYLKRDDVENLRGVHGQTSPLERVMIEKRKAKQVAKRII